MNNEVLFKQMKDELDGISTDKETISIKFVYESLETELTIWKDSEIRIEQKNHLRFYDQSNLFIFDCDKILYVYI